MLGYKDPILFGLWNLFFFVYPRIINSEKVICCEKKPKYGGIYNTYQMKEENGVIIKSRPTVACRECKKTNHQ